MKKNDFTLLLILICGLNLINLFYICDSHEKQMEAIEDLKVLIEERTERDSLCVEHMKNCAFISREDIAVGHQGYLYSKYFNDNLK